MGLKVTVVIGLFGWLVVVLIDASTLNSHATTTYVVEVRQKRSADDKLIEDEDHLPFKLNFIFDEDSEDTDTGSASTGSGNGTLISWNGNLTRDNIQFIRTGVLRPFIVSFDSLLRSPLMYTNMDAVVRFTMLAIRTVLTITNSILNYALTEGVSNLNVIQLLRDIVAKLSSDNNNSS